MPTATAVASILAGLVAVLVGAIYVFGIPSQWKRAMEEKALETMGENKASYMMKGKFWPFHSDHRQGVLTNIYRPDQQSPSIRSERGRRPQERRWKRSWWRTPEPSGEGSWRCW